MSHSSGSSSSSSSENICFLNFNVFIPFFIFKFVLNSDTLSGRSLSPPFSLITNHNMDADRPLNPPREGGCSDPTCPCPGYCSITVDGHPSKVCVLLGLNKFSNTFQIPPGLNTPCVCTHAYLGHRITVPYIQQPTASWHRGQCASTGCAGFYSVCLSSALTRFPLTHLFRISTPGYHRHYANAVLLGSIMQCKLILPL